MSVVKKHSWRLAIIVAKWFHLAAWISECFLAVSLAATAWKVWWVAGSARSSLLPTTRKNLGS